MKKIIYMLIVSILLLSCGDDDSNEDQQIYRQRMRDFVQGISQYARGIDNDFIVIPQNGPELATSNGDAEGVPEMEYMDAIDGVGREDLFYGYDDDNKATPADESAYMLAFLDIFEANGVEVLTTDYCWDHSKMDDSYMKNAEREYISFAAPDRELNLVPDYPVQPYNVNSDDIGTLADARNFLYLLNPENFSNKQEMINTISQTNYDVIIMDMFFDDLEFTSSEIGLLKAKDNGGKRLVISYMSIGEAEDYRFYWDDSWKVGNPSWIERENRDWKGNFKVQYWEPAWQDIIFGNNTSYVKKIIDAGFDGVYLDIIDAFEYFE
jgi:cysteinyl-tRNA synthetase